MLPLIVQILALWLRHDLLVAEVDGRSMAPLLGPDDRLICSRSAPRVRGAIVLRRGSSGGGYFVKRIVALPGEDRMGVTVPPLYFWLEGDNKEVSADSRHYGPVAADEVVAVAVARLAREGLEDVRSDSLKTWF